MMGYEFCSELTIIYFECCLVVGKKEREQDTDREIGVKERDRKGEINK